MNSRFAEHITKEDIQALPLLAFEGKIHTLNTEEECFEAVKELRRFDVIGFDTEKKPTFHKGQYHPTALIQLSTSERVFLFRINQTGFHHELRALFTDPGILKVGIGISDDVKALQKIEHFPPGGFIEIDQITTEIGIKDRGVKKLAGIVLGIRISKNQQTSNWENPELTNPQKRYAATDAWVCSEIYRTLDYKGYL